MSVIAIVASSGVGIVETFAAGEGHFVLQIVREHHFEKVADRNTFDFALVSLAGAMRLRGDVIEDVRLVAGAVECVPRRLQEAEARLRGASLGPGSAEAAAAAAVQDAEPLRHNGFKVPLLGNLVARAVRGD